MAVTDLFARRATLSRSLRLLREFRFEQPDPARFYGALAEDTAALVTDLWRAEHRAAPAGRTLLDVGGGPGYFATAFADAGFTYIGVEPDPAEMHAGPADERRRWPPTCERRGSPAVRRRQRRHLPVFQRRRACVGAVAAGSRDAARHQTGRAGGPVVHGVAGSVRRPRDRVVALPRRGAGRQALHPQARPSPKNNYGSSLFAVSAADGLQWAATTGALLTAFPRYHPRWAWWMTRVPVLREFLVSNLVLVLRPPSADD